MIGFRWFAVAAVVGELTGSIELDGQAAATANSSVTIAVRLTAEKTRIPAGQKVLVDLAIKNLGDLKICILNASYNFRVHVEGKDGEPPMTEWNRHQHGDFRPGDGPSLVDGPVVCSDLAPPMEGYEGMSEVHYFDLGQYYDLSVPGRYSVYMEVRDPTSPSAGPEIWARTNTVQFEVEAKAQ